MTGQVTERDAAFFQDWLVTAADAIRANADRLTDLDSAIGDADHGNNMRRGFSAVAAALADERPDTPGAVLLLGGRTLVSTVGGASGPLFGTLLRRTGKALGEAERVTDEELRVALETGIGAVGQLGGAAAGDKTMLDALLPALDALPDYAAAALAAEEGSRATIPLRAHKGRASYLGERSVGHEDPGAASAALIFRALHEVADR
ncbi:dihydroxyacetone kinase subunit DhaL [Streptomyces profundus]|uniref:dihydroxyacetone kinase subunit DhaL n=1 Tax=Streptomyces profundus TaxID=2867410 RepID=UPI001D16643B|nr:dihydroxyacetone kinase subunit DhaL [Streptomyces sp. MA3_2.13]